MARASAKFGIYEWSALAGYIALLAYAAPHHVPWGDESQAWLLARDSSLGDIFLHRLHYEGTPGLWHALLWLLTRLHMPFAGLHWVAAATATAGVAVWLRYAPLPRWLKLLFPFTFFIAFQYAIVARSYVFYPLLAFAACALIDSGGGEKAERRPRPILLAIVLALLANLCMFGTALAAGLGLVAMDRMRRDGSWKTMRRACAVAVLLLCAAGIFAARTAWPARDIGFTTGVMDLPQVKKALHREEPVAVLSAQTAVAGDSAEAQPAPARHTFLKQRILFAASLLIFPIASQTALALAAVLLLLYRCARRRQWVALLPYLFVFAASVAIYAVEHHSGLLLIAFLAAVWLTWPAAVPAGGLPRWMELGLRAALLVIFVLQIGWTVHAVGSERHTVYAADREAADFLHEHAMGSKIAGYYPMSDGVEVYFPRNIYFNQPSSFWRYSADPRLTMSNAAVLAGHPDYVVLGTVSGQRQMILNQLRLLIDPAADEPGDYEHIGGFFEQNGYRETHRFCGFAPMRSGYSLKLCQIILEPAR